VRIVDLTTFEFLPDFRVVMAAPWIWGIKQLRAVLVSNGYSQLARL
jgi:hypothetical protein